MGAGVSGAFSFATVSPTQDHINFSFFGSNTASGSFTIDLGPFATTNGEMVTGVSFGSGTFSTTSADFSYRFLIGSGRAGSARNGGERAGAQPGRVVADAMRAREPGCYIAAPLPGQCAVAVKRRWARA